jgi:hypothetical protein
MTHLRTTLLRLGLLAATSLAASRYIHRKHTTPETCQMSQMEPCKHTDNDVSAQHALFPLAVVFAYISVVYSPSLLLSSRARAQQLKSGCVRYILLLMGVLSVFQWVASHASLLYVLNLHAAVYYMSEAQEASLLVGKFFDISLRCAAVTAILLYAWNVGPPLSIVPSTVVQGHCCASLVHLAAVLLTELLLPSLLWAFDRMAS